MRQKENEIEFLMKFVPGYKLFEMNILDLFQKKAAKKVKKLGKKVLTKKDSSLYWPFAHGNGERKQEDDL
ncbi:MAG TPA: hypothetical protein PLL06_02550 [Acidobacteriota bacterium]|nr:hypothetical protein [Acidobacteriota bacterium]